MAILSCFTEFCAAAEPLLDRLAINWLVAEYKRVIPRHYKTMKGILGFDKKENYKRNKHLVATGFYDRGFILYVYAA